MLRALFNTHTQTNKQKTKTKTKTKQNKKSFKNESMVASYVSAGGQNAMIGHDIICGVNKKHSAWLLYDVFSVM